MDRVKKNLKKVQKKRGTCGWKNARRQPFQLQVPQCMTLTQGAFMLLTLANKKMKPMTKLR